MPNTETPAPTTECRPCRGDGFVTDVRTASITHRVTTCRRRCRYCKGSGRITVIAPVVPWEVGTGEIPEWMLG